MQDQKEGPTHQQRTKMNSEFLQEFASRDPHAVFGIPARAGVRVLMHFRCFPAQINHTADSTYTHARPDLTQ